jgi:NAD(P)-dependent dehydrogenase (short-subunit alcohol dehydrogenase family)
MNLKPWIQIFCIAAFAAIAALGNPAIAAGNAEAKTVLITGANRGIGLEFARQFSERGYRVIGTARKPEQATALKALEAQVEALDVTDSSSVKALATRLKGTEIDILINNAGTGGYNAASFLEFDFDQLPMTFDVNSLGPMRVTQALFDNLKLGSNKKIIHISSVMGSIEKNQGGYYGYRASKAALNMFNKSLAAELGSQGFVCVVLHPGWVKTRIGGEGAKLSTEESITGMLAVIDQLNSDSNGHFYDYQGNELPW